MLLNLLVEGFLLLLKILLHSLIFSSIKKKLSWLRSGPKSLLHFIYCILKHFLYCSYFFSYLFSALSITNFILIISFNSQFKSV
jgi:hypothetical protein